MERQQQLASKRQYSDELDAARQLRDQMRKEQHDKEKLQDVVQLQLKAQELQTVSQCLMLFISPILHIRFLCTHCGKPDN